jgi:hypothetical protein
MAFSAYVAPLSKIFRAEDRIEKMNDGTCVHTLHTELCYVFKASFILWSLKKS